MTGDQTRRELEEIDRRRVSDHRTTILVTALEDIAKLGSVWGWSATQSIAKTALRAYRGEQP